MATILAYCGAVSLTMAGISMMLHASGLDKTKYGALFCTASNDLIGIIKVLSAGKQ